MRMDMRQLKGLEIAKNGGIRETPKGWIVPSQSGNGAYLVYKEGMGTKCDCPDCQSRGLECKHQWAVKYFYHEVKDEQGNVTVTKAVRMTYPQDWKAYNKAQTSEVRLFDTLLKELVAIIPEQKQVMGRPRLSLNETAFCSIQKVYSQLSQRRAHSLYRNAEEREQISHTPHFNAVGKMLNRKDMTPILEKLLTISALPLRSIETSFAPDSSGFRTSKFGQYAVEKYGTMRKHKWVKAHILTGTKTNVIVGAKIGEENSADCPQFVPLVTEAHDNGFTIEKVTADMGYSSRENYNTATKIGAEAYIPFKSNSTGLSRGSYTWKKMYHFFQFNRDEFMGHYHDRSNVESTFNMVKAKFGDKLKSKNWTAQVNELLCKFIAHNIVVLIHEMHELGVSPSFD
ncbi:MAG: transposase [Candidatus Aenigmarchaeota archaeon]|nr:transposase [Candidatus Aenigmarchaeota archaeon]